MPKRITILSLISYPSSLSLFFEFVFCKARLFKDEISFGVLLSGKKIALLFSSLVLSTLFFSGSTFSCIPEKSEVLLFLSRGTYFGIIQDTVNPKVNKNLSIGKLTDNKNSAN
jgi:hypothetical protein